MPFDHINPVALCIAVPFVLHAMLQVRLAFQRVRA